MKYLAFRADRCDHPAGPFLVEELNDMELRVALVFCQVPHGSFFWTLGN